MRHVVDANGLEVGVLDIATGLVTRLLDGVVVTLSATPNGFVETDVVFLHTSTDCSGTRYLHNNWSAFTHTGALVSGTVFFTMLADPRNPLHPEPLNSYEVVRPGSDPDAMGACTRMAMGRQSVGPVRAVRDPLITGLTAPFRLQ
jgi:hypothetical protein